MKTYHDLVSAAKAQIIEVSQPQAQAACDKADLIIDVREPEEYAAGHIEGALLVPRGILEFKINELTANKGADTDMVIYCQVGGRSALAAQTLQTLGYKNVVSLVDGYEGWAEAGMPVVKEADKS
ncbi:rhodanese-like domain-containing protein [uncultured Psychrobacter sp.]|uniref:rhodanese-like domain-containing protein n=1 Tax=uncultured Psychrobacter sp. TaxID=259303 RepID=UPI003457CAD9